MCTYIMLFRKKTPVASSSGKKTENVSKINHFKQDKENIPRLSGEEKTQQEKKEKQTNR